jgi:hypothetical protein
MNTQRLELAQDLLKQVMNDGGFTYWTTGVPTDTGYMVAKQGTELILDLGDDLAVVITEIANFITRNYMSGHSIGGWYEDGKLYLDVSNWVADKQQAILIGIANKQLAIYEIHTANCINL